ncbi:MDIS1-interacting receptor like kinase 2, partial [Cucurbita argyrosperma subsp. argyrosperma]
MASTRPCFAAWKIVFFALLLLAFNVSARNLVGTNVVARPCFAAWKIVFFALLLLAFNVSARNLVGTNKLDSKIPIELGSLANLGHLDLSKNTLSGSIPFRIGSLVSVEVVKGIIQALSYLHYDCTPPIKHQDITTNNILVNFEFEGHLADFGTTRFLKPDMSRSTTVTNTHGDNSPSEIQTPFFYS